MGTVRSRGLWCSECKLPGSCALRTRRLYYSLIFPVLQEPPVLQDISSQARLALPCCFLYNQSWIEACSARPMPRPLISGYLESVRPSTGDIRPGGGANQSDVSPSITPPIVRVCPLAQPGHVRHSVFAGLLHGFLPLTPKAHLDHGLSQLAQEVMLSGSVPALPIRRCQLSRNGTGIGCGMIGSEPLVLCVGRGALLPGVDDPKFRYSGAASAGW